MSETFTAEEASMDSKVERLPLPEPYRQNPPLLTNVPQQQRDKWRKQWSLMDDDNCSQPHYKHYEWELRKTLDELEARECQIDAQAERLQKAEELLRNVRINPDVCIAISTQVDVNWCKAVDDLLGGIR